MLHIIASGSSGNCYCVETDDELVFVDAGVNKRDLLNFKDKLSCSKKSTLLITHEHIDHIAGLKYMVDLYNPRICASKGTVDALSKKGFDTTDFTLLESGKEYYFENFAARATRVSHDAAETFSYALSVEDGNIGFVTDLGYLTKDHIASLEAVDSLVLECNYDEDMLVSGKYPAGLKRRVRSTRGHLSNKDAMLAIAVLSSANLKNCYLAHISEENNDYSLLEQFAKFSKEQYSVDTHVIRQKTEYTYDLSPFKSLN